ncbi:trichothecene efflux pump [Fusarium denticulatum]|uniref:Trichothecene efflux pump n=1 Tax=Fusarium denticulatum TaxID=48507 RepID=A0A8H5XD32_9HYPO|nr:trichothecene efflux pump [Fusarium denticulatum]
MADGTIEYVDKNAFGDELGLMPNGFFRSPQFVGTLARLHGLWDLLLAFFYRWSSDPYGRKWMVMSTTLLGLNGCVISGTVNSVDMLIASNGRNGLAAAGQLSFGIVLGQLVPNKHRGPIMGVFKNSGFVAVVTCAIVASTVYYSLTVLWPTIISTLYTAYSIKVGCQSCVIDGGVVLGQAMSGLAIAYVPRLKIQCICAAALVMTFITSKCSISPDRWVNTIAFGLIACTPVGYIENVALTCYVSILSNELPRTIPKYVILDTTRSGLPTKSLPSLFEAINKGDYSDVPGTNKVIIDPVGDADVKAYTSSLHYVFYATIPFSCIMLVAAFLVPDIKKFLTYNVAKHLQDKSFRKSSTGANEVEIQALNECHPDEARVASHV